jgi:3-phosphoinositide dependent protein kinase-1
MMIKKRNARDFKFIRLLGEGSFSSVYLAVDADIPNATTTTTTNSNSSSINDQNQSDGQAAAQSLQGGEFRDVIHESNDKTCTTAKRNKKVRKYAIKVCQKSHIKRQGKQMAIMREKEIMNILNHSQCKHFIRLYCTFQDMERLFFVMSYAENGELLTYMLEHPLSIDTVRKFTLQLVSALEHLHKLHIVHRDLKPENILLSELLDLLISDFGSAKIYNRTPQTTTLAQSVTSSTAPSSRSSPSPSQPLSEQTPSHLTTKATDLTSTSAAAPFITENNSRMISSSDRRNSFVGTAQYVSPEMLKNREASNKSDLWALGVIIYQMMTNIMPFDAPNEYLIYKKIQSLDYSYPENFDESARDLVSSLIKLDPNDRLGANDDLQSNGYHSLRTHCFLSNVVDEQLVAVSDDDSDGLQWNDIVQADPDLRNIGKIQPGLDETQMLRLLTDD